MKFAPIPDADNYPMRTMLWRPRSLELLSKDIDTLELVSLRAVMKMPVTVHELRSC